MDDDSMEVIELVQPNSGLPTGKLLHRDKIRLADGTHLTWPMLKVCGALTAGRHILGGEFL